jgi:hypothetical protein
MLRRFLVSIFVVILIAVGAVAVAYYFDREPPTMNAEDGYGTEPRLPQPSSTVFPTVDIAQAPDQPRQATNNRGART